MNKLIPTRAWLSYDNQSVLRTKCKEVNISDLTESDHLLMDKMMAYIDATYEEKAKKYHIVPGIAIAANQLGVDKQIVYIHFNEGKNEYKYMLFNPKILKTSLTKTYIPVGEGCLSVKDEYDGVSIRYKTVQVKAYDYLLQKDIIINANGLLAICLQHEIDHLNGLLFYDRIGDENMYKNIEPYQAKEE